MASTLEPPQRDAKLLTPAEVAERLQVSLWTVYRKVESGEIPAVKLGTGKRSPVRIEICARLHNARRGRLARPC